MLYKIDLQQVQIASPCPASWDDMEGDNKCRLCSSCNKHVYNFSEMSLEEGTALIVAKEGQLCGRISRRQDGMIITKDYPVGFGSKIYHRCMYAVLVASLLLISVFWLSSKSSRFPQAEAFIAWINHYLEKFSWKSNSQTFSMTNGMIYCPPSIPPKQDSK